MSASMFPTGYASHDPGGKVRMKLQPGVIGGAQFSPCGRYRPILFRRWGTEGVDAPYFLFVGMNPSTAEAGIDDPTIRREIGFTKREGASCYVKVNVADYRATDPRALDAIADPRSPENLATIMQAAHGASRVVLAFGALKGRMREFASETVAHLKHHRIALGCLGTTADLSPRHPLYVRANAELVEWNGWT